jgi:ATP-binding protein involved in chromosome partitioning
LVDKEDIMKELAKVIDPEIGIPITEMKLIDNIKINDNEVTIEYHLTMPFCPPVFALSIGQDIKRRVSAIDDVTKVTTVLSGHQMGEDINKKVNSSD